MAYVRKVRWDGGSVVVTIPSALKYTDGDHVEIAEEVAGVSFRVTKLTKMTAKEPEEESSG